MVTYSTSPSLHKPNQFSESPRRMARFRSSNILGDPFALATISISIVRAFQVIVYMLLMVLLLACLVDRFHIVHCCVHPDVRLSKLCMVDCCLYALHHCRSNSRYWFGHWPCLWSSSTSFTCCLEFALTKTRLWGIYQLLL